MATYSRTDRLEAIRKAGFADPLTALAVSLAEFGENRDINTQSQSDYIGPSGREESYGPWQIHLPSHPDVTRSCAMDLECSTAEAKKISKGGADFGAWSAFNNGSYERFIAEIKSLFDVPAAAPSDSASPGGSAGGGSTPSAGASAADACANVPSSTITSVRTSMGALIKGGKDAVSIAEALKALYPTTPVACLQQIAYGSANAIKDAPDQVAARAVTGAVKNAISVGDLLKSENLWRAGFLVLGAALIFFGARMYLSPGHEEEVSREGMAA